MTDQELMAYFGNLPVPPKLSALAAFERKFASGEYFSESFEFSIDAEKYIVKTWSEDPKFLAALWPFAQADGTGSMYAFWIPDEKTSLEAAPIVVFGSEGGYHVIAQSFDQLLQILSFDTEVMVDHEEAYYYRGRDAEPSAKSGIFHDWLKSEYGIDLILDADHIVAMAQKTHGKRFREWVGRFVED